MRPHRYAGGKNSPPNVHALLRNDPRWKQETGNYVEDNNVGDHVEARIRTHTEAKSNKATAAKHFSKKLTNGESEIAGASFLN
jgi:hypothetical protein